MIELEHKGTLRTKVVDQRVMDRARIACNTPSALGHLIIGELLVRYLKGQKTASEVIAWLNATVPFKK